MPPLTCKTCPVIYDDWSDDKNTQASAMSFGVPPRFNGMPSRHVFTVASSNYEVISVSINPGAITLHLMFREPSSRATDLENPIIPAFEAA